MTVHNLALSLVEAVPAGFNDELNETLLSRARDLHPLLLKYAQSNEDSGEIAPEVMAALEDADLLRMSAPRRWGGLCISSETMSNVSREIAKGCPSTAWVVSIINSCIWLASTLGPSVQEAIFANGVPKMCGPQNGAGQIVPDGDHFVVDGKWSYASASHHAEWVMVPAVSPEGKLHMVAIPMSEVEIENSWQVAGMKGTGSDTIVAKGAVVKAGQFCEIAANAVGLVSSEGRYVKEATDYWAGFPLLRAKALGVLIGAAEGLLKSVIDLKNRPIIYSTFAKRVDSEVWQAGIGKAAAQIGVAASIADKHNRYNDAAAAGAHVLDYPERAVCRGECSVAGDLLTEAVNDLMNLAGSSAFATKSTSQRYWRDFSIGMRHVIFSSDLGYEVFGKQIMGIEPNIVGPDHV